MASSSCRQNGEETMSIYSGKVMNAKVAILGAVDEACRQVEDEGDFVMQPVSRAIDDLIAEVRAELKDLLSLAEKSNKDWRWALDQLDAPPIHGIEMKREPVFTRAEMKRALTAAIAAMHPVERADVFGQIDHETVLRLTNIRTAVARARQYGHSATTHTPEHVIARKDELLDQALSWLAEIGFGGSVLRGANVSAATRSDSVVAEGVTLPVGEKPASQEWEPSGKCQYDKCDGGKFDWFCVKCGGIQVPPEAEKPALLAYEDLRAIEMGWEEIQPKPMALLRYGVIWRGHNNQPTQPILELMHDGYWTPWHLAQAEIDRLGEKSASTCHGGLPHYCPNCDRSF
jgi:hypothetical protein